MRSTATNGSASRRLAVEWLEQPEASPAVVALLLLLAGTMGLHAQTNNGNLSLNIGLNGLNQPVDVDGAIKVLAVMTLLTLAPSIILLMTCFTRIVIVLSFVRSAQLDGATVRPSIGGPPMPGRSF